MAACLVATYSGSDFLGQLLTIESSGFCAVPCKEDPQKVEFLDNAHIVEGGVILFPVGPFSKGHDGALFGGGVPVELGACGLLEELEGVIQQFELLDGGDYSFHIIYETKDL